jgi:death-on-curing protein
MKEPKWLDKEALMLLHGMSLARFGGAPGIRDEGLLESALIRPINQFDLGSDLDLVDIAAAYAFGLGKNHAFVDGNKRIAFLACGLFLEQNGKRLNAEPLDAIAAVMALAAGDIGEKEFAAWLRGNIGN